MSERGRSPSSTTSSPGGSPSRHSRARQHRAETKPSPRTPPRHRHIQRENDARDNKINKAKRSAKDIKQLSEDQKRTPPGSPSRGRSASQRGSVSSVSSAKSGSGTNNCPNNSSHGFAVAVACDSDAAILFDNPKPVKVAEKRGDRMDESRTSQISDSGVESMDSEKLKSKLKVNGEEMDTDTAQSSSCDHSSQSQSSSEPEVEMRLVSASKDDLSTKCDDGNSDNNEEDQEVLPPEEPEEESLESKYDLLPSTSGKGFLGVLGYKRMDLLDGDSDVMASSIICTDGSDVEALSEVDDNENELDDINDNDKDSSDSIDILDPDNGSDNKHILRYNSDDQLFENSEADASNLKTITRDGDQGCETSPSQEDLDDLEERDASPIVPLPVDAIVELRSTEPGALLGKLDSLHASDQDSDSHIDSDTSDGGAGNMGEYLNYEDVMSQLIYGYTKMTDSGIDQLGANSISRPDSLCLPRPMHKRIHRSESNSSSVHSYSSTEALIEAATVTPLYAQGTVDQEGEMIAFVAQDLAEKIRMSSPLTRSSRGDNSSAASYAGGSQTPSGRSVSSVNSMSSSASGWSTSSASGWSAISNTSGMSRSPSLLTQSPEDIPPIDPRAVLELELNARRVAENLDIMMANLKGSLNKMSALTVNCVGAYRGGIDHTCDSVDGAIKSMYALMAKCEELSKNMKPIYHLADQIKEIKRLLDLFEAQIAREEK